MIVEDQVLHIEVDAARLTASGLTKQHIEPFSRHKNRGAIYRSLKPAATSFGKQRNQPG